jgi:hypothetical protein
MSQRVLSLIKNSQIKNILFPKKSKRLEPSIVPADLKISAFSSLSSKCVPSSVNALHRYDRRRPSTSSSVGKGADADAPVSDYASNPVKPFRSYSTYSGPRDLLDIEPNEFVEYLKKKKIQRCFMVHDPVLRKPVVSHPELQEFANFFTRDEIDYRDHEGVFMEIGPRSNCLLGAFVWNTNRGQAVSIVSFIHAVI